MSSNNTRQILVNVLVNGNIYTPQKAIDIDLVIETESSAIDKFMRKFSEITEIPYKLLSYEIVSEVSERQSLVLDALENAFLKAGYHKELINGGLVIEDGKAIKFMFKFGDIGEVTIHAKDIIIKE
jgi:hypothetical protein